MKRRTSCTTHSAIQYSTYTHIRFAIVVYEPGQYCLLAYINIKKCSRRERIECGGMSIFIYAFKHKQINASCADSRSACRLFSIKSRVERASK